MDEVLGAAIIVKEGETLFKTPNMPPHLLSTLAEMDQNSAH
jgi:hypothetical protein